MTILESFSLAGRRAVVTGGARGLGLAIARGLAEAGARVAIVSRTAAELEAAAAEIGEGAVAVTADVAAEIDAASSGRLVDTLEAALDGAVDIVVHAAGVQHRAPAEEFPAGEWERVLRINLSAPFALSREIGRRQLADGRPGSHIFIGSLTSGLSVPDVVAYTASKSGVHGVARNLSSEWSGRGIRANVISPGYFRTSLTEAVFEDPERYRLMLDRIPMGRFGEPEELAGAAVFLASEASRYITGQMIFVDGGWTAA